MERYQQVEDAVRQACMRCSDGAVGIDADAQLACALLPPFPCALLTLLKACRLDPDLVTLVEPGFIPANARALPPADIEIALKASTTGASRATPDPPTTRRRSR